MADIIWSDVVNHAAELSAVSSTVQTEILAYVNSVIQVALVDGETGPKTKLVRIYLAAHMATASAAASSSGASSGAITSHKEGDVAVTYAATATAAASTPDTTFYGQMYLRLIGTTALRAPLLL